MTRRPSPRAAAPHRAGRHRQYEIDTVTGTVTFTDADLTDRPVVTAAISTTDPFRYFDAEGHDVTATLTQAQLAAIRPSQCR